MLFLDSITSPKTQVLLSYFLWLSISRPFSLHHLFATSECSLSSSYLSSCCSQSISHSLSFTLHSGPPAATNVASLVFSTCLLSDLHFLCDNPFLFISRSFFLCLNLPLASLLLWESICNLSHTSARSPACASYLFLFQWLFLCFSLSLFVFVYLFLISLSQDFVALLLLNDIARPLRSPICVINRGWIRLTFCFAHY